MPPKKQKKSTKKSVKKTDKNKQVDNFINKNYDLLKVKNSYLNVLGFSIFLLIVVIIIMAYIIYYLNQLKTCSCFQDENEINKTNLDYLIVLEAVGIGLNIIMVIQLIALYISLMSMKGGGNSSTLKLSILIIMFLYIIIYGYFVYFVYKLSQNIKYDCICAQSPIRFLLYFQAFLIFIYLLFIVVGLINL